MAETGHQRERVVAQVEQLDDRGHPVTVWLVQHADGSWLIEGVGGYAVRLSREVMQVVAQAVLCPAAVHHRRPG